MLPNILVYSRCLSAINKHLHTNSLVLSSLLKGSTENQSHFRVSMSQMLCNAQDTTRIKIWTLDIYNRKSAVKTNRQNFNHLLFSVFLIITHYPHCVVVIIYMYFAQFETKEQALKAFQPRWNQNLIINLNKLNVGPLVF